MKSINQVSLTIYSAITNLDIKDIESKYKDASSGFKADLAEIVAEHIGQIQENYKTLIASNTLDDILDAGAQKASMYAQRKLSKILSKMGLKEKK